MLSKDCGKGGNINREDDSSVSFPVSKIHRAIAQGFSNSLKVSTRSCYSCACCKVGDNANCVKSADDAEGDSHWLEGQCSHELVAVAIASKTEQECQYTSSPVKELADEVYSSAQEGHVLAIESQSEVEPMWLVRVLQKHPELAEDKTLDDWGVTYLCNGGEGALEVTRLFISSTKATNTFCDDVQKESFFVPTMLLRSFDLSSEMKQKENTIQTDGNNRSRAAVEVVGESADEQPTVYYELDAAKRREVALVCREFA